MLKAMRASFHQLKWTLFAVIVVFILGFVYFSGDPGSADTSVAKVGSERISGVEFDRQYRRYAEQYREIYRGGLTPELARALDLPRQVLDAMIERMLRLEAARKLNLRVSDQEVARRIVTLPFFQENGVFIGQEKYLQRLRSYGISPDSFEEDLREDLLLEKYQALVKAAILVPDSELLREFSTRNDKASIEYLLVPSSRLETEVKPTDAELQAYHEKHKERYRTPEQRRTKYLLVERDRVRPKISVPEKELREEYENRRDAFTQPEQVTVSHILVKADPAGGAAADAAAKKNAEALLARAQGGEDFAKLANENTEDPTGRGTGGSVPPFGRGQTDPAFEKEAFEMAPGEIRGPVKTQYGYHIIRAIGKTPAGTRPFEQVRASLAAELTERKTTAETERIARELVEKIRSAKAKSDEELRKFQNGTVTYNTTEWISRGEDIPGIGVNPGFSEEAWRLKVGEVSSTLVETIRGVAILKTADERAAGVPPLAEIRARVVEDFSAERRKQNALEALQPAARELASGGSLPTLASRYGTEVKTTPEFGPGGPIPEIGAAPELAEAVFQTPAGQAGPPVAVPTGFVLFRVLTRAQGDRAAFERQKEELRENIRSREAERLLRSYLQQMRADRKVQVNEEILGSYLPAPSSGRRG